jgi:hypothetical protein
MTTELIFLNNGCPFPQCIILNANSGFTPLIAKGDTDTLFIFGFESSIRHDMGA